MSIFKKYRKNIENIKWNLDPYSSLKDLYTNYREEKI
jgi:hypothetical protein